MKIGFLVNPVAGMGGSVGLKGTDGKDVQAEAVRRGATRISPARAETALRSVKDMSVEVEWLTCSGAMGRQELDNTNIRSTVVYESPSTTSGEDSIHAARKFQELRVDLIVFVGGDGTARDVLEAVGEKLPILGVPSGVKMHSAVFLHRPDDLGDTLMTFVTSRVTRDAEVMDVNEDAFRQGSLEAKMYGIARVPDNPAHVQSAKMSYHSGTADDEIQEIGQYFADIMEHDVLYIVGPGSTTAGIARAIAQQKTLLGTDVYLNRKAVLLDAGERQLLELLDKHKNARVIVTPIGSQGFFLGRGNQQISPAVLQRVGKGNIVVVATPTKLKDLSCLRVDSGDAAFDLDLKGKIRVVTGYKRKKLVEVK